VSGRPAPGPLTGTAVVVTRSRAQASSLVDRLAGEGATVVELPVIAIEDPPDGGRDLGQAAGRAVAGDYDWLVFTSTNAAARFLAALGDRPVPASTRWAAVGPGTAATLHGGGHPPDLVPATSVAEALADEFPDAPARTGATPGSRVLFPRAESVSGVLASGLRAKEWSVDEVVAYRTVAGSPDPGALAAAGRADAVAFTSSSTVERTVSLLGLDRIPPVVASIGPVTSASALAAGLSVTVEATEHTIDGLVAALVAALGEGGAASG
jgi:uroporphyrinogen III methyltransferase/synthase